MKFYCLFVISMSAIPLFSGILIGQEEYVKIQKFEEIYKSTVIIPGEEAYPDKSKGHNTVNVEGLLKWIQDDPNGFILDVEIQKATMDYRDARTEELPRDYEEDRKKWSNPYTARVWCSRGDPGECKIEIIKNKDENDYLGTQYRRVSQILDNLLLTANSIQFEAKPNIGEVNCIIDYIDVIKWGEQYTHDLSKSGNRPDGLLLIYKCQDKTFAATLQSYHFDGSGLLKYQYLFNPVSQKVSEMQRTSIQITDLTNLIELTSSELYKHLNDSDAPLRRVFYEIKLAE